MTAHALPACPAPSPNRRLLAPAVLAMAGVLWGAGILTGLKVLWNYETTPGASAEPPVEWPADTRLERAPGRPTLIMLAHPRCSCTQASLVELNELMAQVHDAVSAYVLFVKPGDLPEGWEDTGTWARAREIPGVTVLLDEAGEEARRFDARTSGQTVVYDAAGRLIFSGGITAARGHEGDNAGRRRIVALLTTGAADRRDSAVFGCSLSDAPGDTR